MTRQETVNEFLKHIPENNLRVCDAVTCACMGCLGMPLYGIPSDGVPVNQAELDVFIKENGILDRVINSNSSMAFTNNSLPFFRTSDGVDIFLNDSYWFFDERWKIYRTKVVSTQDISKGVMQFKSFEKMQEHIINNKPFLSINDVKSVYADDRSFIGTDFLIERLTQLVKSKIKISWPQM